MKIEYKENGRVIIEHNGLMVAGDTLEEAVIEYGEGMKERGESYQKTSNGINNASVY